MQVVRLERELKESQESCVAAQSEAQQAARDLRRAPGYFSGAATKIEKAELLLREARFNLQVEIKRNRVRERVLNREKGAMCTQFREQLNSEVAPHPTHFPPSSPHHFHLRPLFRTVTHDFHIPLGGCRRL